MNSGQSLFSQFTDHLPKHEFRKCVERYSGDYRLRTFSCWDHFCVWPFAQMTYRESLRDIVACMRWHSASKLYHLGIRGTVRAQHAGRCQRDCATGASMPISRRY